MRKRLEPIVSIVILAIALFIVFVAISRGQSSEAIATGGQFTLEKQVIAGGGNAMQHLTYVQGGTGGQTVSGARSTGGQFHVYSGFWTPDDFAPTAPTAVITGRVTTFDGAGIRNAVITVTFPSGETRSAVSGSLGRYLITGIPIGETCVIQVSSKRFAFAVPTVVREVSDDIRDADFVASEQ
jgi:hypothetical protein